MATYIYMCKTDIYELNFAKYMCECKKNKIYIKS